MKSAVIIAIIAVMGLGCSSCATRPEMGPNDTVANTTANYDFKGDITRDGGKDCWYYCPWQ